jgi:long-chain acyl-CoA synthetase
VEKGPALKRRLFNWAVGVGRRYRGAEAGGAVPTGLALRHTLADRLVFSKIRAATGGRMKFYAAAGAPLPAELAEFFHAVGIKILEVYGMTELTGAVTVNRSDDFLFGSVGKACPGIELKITEEGEVCVKGDVVMQQYWNNPEATAETIDADGWLHTGDVGHLDDDGFLYITDRMKELIVTAGGKNVAPQPLENTLKTDKFIGQVMVIGDRRNFISALIVPEREVLEPWAAEQGIDGDFRELCADRRVIDHFRAIVDERMEAFSRYERVREFRLVPDEFSQEAGELTPTLKLKRRFLLKKYEDLIDEMYTKQATT